TLQTYFRRPPMKLLNPLAMSFATACTVLTGTCMVTAFLVPDPLTALEGDAFDSAAPARRGMPFCHSALGAATAYAHIMMRVAASGREVPKGEIQAATSSADFADSDPPLWDGLGSVTYKISTASAGAQRYFDQGLRLIYAFNHGEAQRAFRKSQK